MQDTTLRVSGMTCKGCVARVTRALEQTAGVHEVEINLREGLARIRHVTELTATQLAARVTGVGYPARAA